MAKKNTPVEETEAPEIIEVPIDFLEDIADPAVEEIEAVKPAESVYTAEELAANHKMFKTSHAVVTVALRLAGKKTVTLSEAAKIIEEFKNKEVK